MADFYLVPQGTVYVIIYSLVDFVTFRIGSSMVSNVQLNTIFIIKCELCSLYVCRVPTCLKLCYCVKSK